jgi:hypothetical protein
MANTILAFPNWLQETTAFTPSIDAAGSWESDLPVANVLNPLLAKVARSTDATLTSTKLRIDLGAERDIRVVSIPQSNISTSGQVRVTLYSDAAYSVQVATTGWVDYWADVYEWGVRPWGTPDLFSNKFSTEESAGYPSTWYSVFSAVQNAQYIEIEIDDTSNPDGYIDLARVVLAPAWQATEAPLIGRTLIRWEQRSRVRRSRTGVRFVDRQPAPRVAVFGFEHINQDEAFTYPFEMARRQDLDLEVFVITDPADVEQALRRAFLGALRTLPDLTYTDGGRMAALVEIEEIL